MGPAIFKYKMAFLNKCKILALDKVEVKILVLLHFLSAVNRYFPISDFEDYINYISCSVL